MKQHLVLFVLFVLVMLTACGSPAEWKTFSSQSGNFSVLAPGDFKESVQNMPAGPFTVELHSFALTQGATAYYLAYTDFPADAIKQANANNLLEGGVQGALNSTGATLVNKRDVSLNGAPGKEMTGEIPAGKAFAGGGVYKVRAYLVGARLYQVAIATPKGDNALKDADKYLDSFKLLAAAK